MTAPDFAINGRFLTQPITGVQRYARSVVAAMDAILTPDGRSAGILAPPDTADLGLDALPVATVGRSSGHVWEQTALPRAARGRLLNLGNTAPATKRDQVVCIHDANVFESPQSYGRAFRTLYGALLPMLARRSARIATVSGDSARQISKHLGLRASDVAVLPNGHEHALAWDPGRSVAARTGLEAIQTRGYRPFVLAIGSRALHKNMALLETIARDLDVIGIDVVVAGGAAGLFKMTGQAVAPNFFHLGQVSDDDLAYLLDRALCLAFPSWTEGFGLPIVEAMARGCPVASSNRASMPEVCGDAAILLAPDDPRGWYGAIARLSRTPALRDDLIGRGKDQVRRFSWSTTAAGYLSLMENPARRLHRPQGGDRPLPSIGVAIPTLGRPELVNATVRHLMATQTLKPAAIVVSHVHAGDEGDLAALPGVTVLASPSGLSIQRNLALEALMSQVEVVVFFDDDFVADPTWLERVARTFHDDPTLVGLTGRIIADDVTGPGLSFDEAVRLLAADQPPERETWDEPFSPYGCNMAFRVSEIGDVRFDERLPLYSWLEDRDFAATLANKGGRMARTSIASGVHMGAKGGRSTGRPLGYSQIANPLHMLAKGTMSGREVAGQIFRNLASNSVKSLKPEPFVDRRGRLAGNAIALVDTLRGARRPERAADLKRKS